MAEVYSYSLRRDKLIRNSSYNTAISAASIFAGKGKSLVAVPGSLLSELVSISTPVAPGFRSLGSENAVEMFGYQLFHSTDDHDGPSTHSLALGKAVDDLSSLVANHIAFAKNIVKPLVVDLANILDQRAQELKSAPPGSNIVLQVCTIPDLLKDDSFLDSLSFYKGQTPVSPKGSLKLESLSNNEIRALMQTGHQRTDELVTAWLSTLTPDFPRFIWNNYFTLNNNDAVSDNVYIPENDTAFGRVDLFLGTYLVARRILDEVMTSDMTLANYKNLVTDIRDYAGASLVVQLREIYRAVEAKTLVVAALINQKKLIINGELYSDWLNAGGKPEILMGMLVSNQVSTKQAMIDEKAEQHLRKWETYQMLETTRNNNAFFDRYKMAIVEAFASQMVELTDAEKEMNLRNADRFDSILIRARDYISGLKQDDLTKVHEIALKLVAEIRFKHTSAYQMLNDIEEAFKANPNIDVREAALFAAINYLGDWLGDMVTTK